MKIYLKWRNVSKGNVGRFIVAFNDPFQFGKSKKNQFIIRFAQNIHKKMLKEKSDFISEFIRNIRWHIACGRGLL